MARRAAIPVVSIAALLLLSACGTDGPGGTPGAATSGVTVRDSAGIRIVENHDSAWTDETRWRIADSPEVVIGSLDGSVPGTDFGRYVVPRALGARTIVLDASNRDVRLFDADGVFVETVARRGEGPTELSGASRMAVLGDSVALVFDSRGPKIVRYDLVGGSAASESMGRPPGEPSGGLRIGGMSMWGVDGWFADGSYLVGPTVLSMSGYPAGRTVVTNAWHHIAATGEHLGEVGEYPARVMWSDGESSTGMAFNPVGVVLPRDSTVLQAFPDDGFEYVERGTDGRPQTIVRAAIPRRAVTDGMVAELRESEMAFHRAGLEGASARMREVRERNVELQASRPYPDSAAPFTDLLTTPSGHVLAELADPDWIASRRPDTPDPPRTRRYVVFGPDARWLGTLEAPTGLTVTDVSGDALVGVRTDEFDVPYVERWRILKPD